MTRALVTKMTEGMMTRVAAAIVLLLASPCTARAEWTPIAPGLEYGEFQACSPSSHDDSKITVVRVVPHQVQLRILSAADLGLPGPLRAEEWAERFDLSLVINAGLFAADWRTHLGYLKIQDGHVNNPTVRQDYKSVLVFDPLAPGQPEAGILDAEHTTIPELSAKYGAVVQNLRIVRSPGTVVWSRSPRKWSEAAVGMDRSGRLLFIFCRSPYTMHELGQCLLSLPLDLVAVQHLEGGGDASLVIRTQSMRKILVGSYESGANDGIAKPYEVITKGFPLPNVLVVSARR